MEMIGTKTLETDRLILRKFTMDDVNDVFKNYGSDPNVTKYLSWKTHESIEDAKVSVEYFMSSYKDNGYHWAVVLKDINEVIGDIKVHTIDKRNNICEIGYQYGSKFWGKGYATEALKIVIEFLFDECEFHLIEARHRSSNPASGKVMEKAGMTKDAVLKNRRYNKYTDSYEDLVIYSIINNKR